MPTAAWKLLGIISSRWKSYNKKWRNQKTFRFNIITTKGKSHNNNWIIELQTSTNGKSVDLQKYNVSCFRGVGNHSNRRRV